MLKNGMVVSASMLGIIGKAISSLYSVTGIRVKAGS